MAKDLWKPYKIPVVVLAGETGSGKTLWGLTADPDILNFDVPPPVITWDTEGSSESYKDHLNFKRIDLVKRCVEMFGADYNPEKMFLAFKSDIEALVPGKYSVAMIDTASEIEAGHADYIRTHPGECGYTSVQFAKAASLMWGAVKADYKKLMMALASKVETLVICVHMRDEFKSGRPTNKRKPKGKDTLMEIASLYMVLDRSAPAGKKDPPMVPSGITNPPTGKTRIIGIVNGKVQQLLPPYLKDASPDGIRHYLSTPPDFTSLAPSERAKPVQVMTDDDRLELRSSIAADEAARANAELATEELRREVRSEVDVPASQLSVPSKDSTRIKCNTKAENVKCGLLDVVPVEEAVKILHSRYGVAKIAELSDKQLDDLSEHITTVLLKN